MSNGVRPSESYVLKMSFDWNDPNILGSLDYDFYRLRFHGNNDPAMPVRVPEQAGTTRGTPNARYRITSRSMFTMELTGTNMPGDGTITDPPGLVIECTQNGHLVNPPVWLGNAKVCNNNPPTPLSLRIPNLPCTGASVWNFAITPRTLGDDSGYQYWYIRTDNNQDNDEEYKVTTTLVIGGKVYKFDPIVIVGK